MEFPSASRSLFGIPGTSPRHLERTAQPTCFVHIGTHKTGTTSLQHLINQNASVLGMAGVLVPRAGRPSYNDGHHNIAWQLSGDKRFSAHFGTFDELIEEVKRVGAPTVCISSEDFEYLAHAPAALRRLRAAFEQIGYAVSIVVYLRPQAGYAESLYAELLNHGYSQAFETYLQFIIRDGAIAFGSWQFHFDYDVLLENFAAVFGPEHIIVRPYSAARMFDSLAHDFLRTVGAFETSRPSLKQSARRLNAGPKFAAVVRRYRQNLRAAGYTGNFARHALPGNRRPFNPLGLAQVELVAQRFAAGNGRVFRRYGVRIACITRQELVADIVAALVGRDAQDSSVLFDVGPDEDEHKRRPTTSG